MKTQEFYKIKIDDKTLDATYDSQHNSVTIGYKEDNFSPTTVRLESVKPLVKLLTNLLEQINIR